MVDDTQMELVHDHFGHPTADFFDITTKKRDISQVMEAMLVEVEGRYHNEDATDG